MILALVKSQKKELSDTKIAFIIFAASVVIGSIVFRVGLYTGEMNMCPPVEKPQAIVVTETGNSISPKCTPIHGEVDGHCLHDLLSSNEFGYIMNIGIELQKSIDKPCYGVENITNIDYVGFQQCVSRGTNRCACVKKHTTYDTPSWIDPLSPSSK